MSTKRGDEKVKKKRQDNALLVLSKRLTDNQLTFCNRYLDNGGNASKAFAATYDTSNMKTKTISDRALDMLKKPHVAAFIHNMKRSQGLKLY